MSELTRITQFINLLTDKVQHLSDQGVVSRGWAHGFLPPLPPAHPEGLWPLYRRQWDWRETSQPETREPKHYRIHLKLPHTGRGKLLEWTGTQDSIKSGAEHWYPNRASLPGWPSYTRFHYQNVHLSRGHAEELKPHPSQFSKSTPQNPCNSATPS